jgi:hypothetical protein
VEATVADPDRLGTILAQLPGATVVCWLMGDAGAAVNGERLPTLAERLVDSGVRGLVYEAAGRGDAAALEEGAEAALRVGETFRMPVYVMETDPAEHDLWLHGMRAAVNEML